MSDTWGNVIRPGASGEQGPDAEMDPIRSVANIQCSVSKSSSVFSTVHFTGSEWSLYWMLSKRLLVEENLNILNVLTLSPIDPITPSSILILGSPLKPPGFI